MPPILILPSRTHDASVLGRPRPPLTATLIGGALGAIAPATHASMFAGETLDAVANGISWAVLVLVPVIGIVLFWIVHVLPEKIAHRRHHPQVQAIQTLCLLSLVFGGLLWPIAWLWAYTKPVGYKLAYGTDKHEEYFDEQAVRARSGALSEEERALLRDELDAMNARGMLPQRFAGLREELAERPAAEAGSA